MNKFILAALLLMSSMSFAYRDGEYYVESSKSIWFWKPFTRIVVKDGKIVEVEHDRHQKNKLASQNASYNKNMLKKTGVSPALYSVKLPENFFKAKGKLEDMDGIAGATDSYRHFKVMMKFLMEKAEEGKPGKYTIEKSELK